MVKRVQAAAYIRTSSAQNIGRDKDSEKRQRGSIQEFAKVAGYEVAEFFNDEAVSGADALDRRPGFSAMLAWCREHGVTTIIVENASRFARDIIVQETGYRLLSGEGFRLIAADSPNAFLDDTPTAKMVRQILGVVAEFEKANLVAKLRGARDRASAPRVKAGGARIEGRKGYDETNPDMVEEARKLNRKPPKGKRMTLAQIAAALFEKGYTTASGKPFSPSQVQRLIDPEARAKARVTEKKRAAAKAKERAAA